MLTECHSLIFVYVCALCFVLNTSQPLEVFVEIEGVSVTLRKSESVIFQSNASSVQIDISSHKCSVKDTKIVTLNHVCKEKEDDNPESLFVDSASLEKWYILTLMDCDQLLLSFSVDDIIIRPVAVAYEETTPNCEVTEMEFNFTRVNKLALISGQFEKDETENRKACSAFVKQKHDIAIDTDPVTSDGPYVIECSVRLVTSLRTSLQRKQILITALMICLVALLSLCYISHCRRKETVRMNHNASNTRFGSLTLYSPCVPRRVHTDAVSTSLVDATIPATLSITCVPSQTEIVPLPCPTNGAGRSRGNTTRYVTRRRAASRSSSPSDTDTSEPTPPGYIRTTPFLNEVPRTTQDIMTLAASKGGRQVDPPPPYDDIQEDEKQEEVKVNEEDPPSYWEVKSDKSQDDTKDQVKLIQYHK